MAHAGTIKSSLSKTSATRPFIASYDLGYEFTQEHYIALQCMVEDADVEASLADVTPAERVAA